MSYADAKFKDLRGAQALSPEQFRARMRIMWLVLAAAVVALLARAVQLQLISQDFYAAQGRARHIRPAKLEAHRGAILDRNGESLAVSTPVDTVAMNPQEVKAAADQLPRLAEALNRDPTWLTQLLSSNLDREFVYLKRHMPPQDAAQVAALKIPGIELHREYRRYYPAGEVTGHLLGFTNIDDVGQEGMELAFNHMLASQSGVKRVLRDLRGNVIEDVESIRPARPGVDLVSSIDLRLQYLAYRELKLRGGDRRAHRRSAGHGEPAELQSQRPRTARSAQLPQPRRDRYSRARFEHQAFRCGRRIGNRPLQRRDAHRYFARIRARGH
jgi:cell division protein FtsI (penicillin-binding protein 3)